VDTGSEGGPEVSRRGPRRRQTVTGFIQEAQARADLHREVLGEDVAAKLSHHAERLNHHHGRYVAELHRLQAASRDVGIDLSQLL
jgi:hypothetical protein